MHACGGAPAIQAQRQVPASMIALKNAAIRLLALLALQTLWLETSHSQVPGGAPFSDEISKQESIYRGTGPQVVEGYTTDRSLKDYAGLLPSGFDRALANLGPDDRWLDIGAGKGEAILDYFTLDPDPIDPGGRERGGRKAQAVAMSIEDGRTSRWHEIAARLGADKVDYLYNRRLREYSLDELGRFRVISDVVGGFSYTSNLSLFMEKVLGFLELSGSFFTLLQDVRAEGGWNRPHYAGSPFLTEIARADGSEVRICTWLKSIRCVEVTCEFKTGFIPHVEAYRVRKVCNDVAVPALASVHYQAGTPPERRFESRNPAPATGPAGGAR